MAFRKDLHEPRNTYLTVAIQAAHSPNGSPGTIYNAAISIFIVRT